MELSEMQLNDLKECLLASSLLHIVELNEEREGNEEKERGSW